MNRILVIATALLAPCAFGQSRDMPLQPGDDGIYEVAEVQPELLGGLADLQGRIVYPESARNAGIEGQVVVQFVVDASGDVVDPVVLRSPSPELADAALVAVQESRFTPGRVGGQPVPVRFAVPVTFRLPASEASGSVSWDIDYGDLEGAVNYRASMTARMDAMALGRIAYDSDPFEDLTLGSAVVNFRVSSRGRAEGIEIVNATSPVVERFARFQALSTRFKYDAQGRSGSMTVTVESVPQ